MVLERNTLGNINILQKIPVIRIKHIDIGEAYGLHTWHSIQAQIDAVNEIASTYEPSCKDTGSLL